MLQMTNLVMTLKDEALEHLLVDLELTYFEGNIRSPKPVLVLDHLGDGMEGESLEHLLQQNKRHIGHIVHLRNNFNQ